MLLRAVGLRGVHEALMGNRNINGHLIGIVYPRDFIYATRRRLVSKPMKLLGRGFQSWMIKQSTCDSSSFLKWKQGLHCHTNNRFPAGKR